MPYLAIVLGWWISNMAAGGRQDEGYWETASSWVYRGVAIAILAAGWAWLKLVHGIRRTEHQALAAVLGLGYIASLIALNFWAYTMTRGPFS